MKDMTKNTTAEMGRPAQIHMVWIGEEDRVASFHAVDTYELRTFACHDFFLDYLRSLQERGFRFQ